LLPRLARLRTAAMTFHCTKANDVGLDDFVLELAYKVPEEATDEEKYRLGKQHMQGTDVSDCVVAQVDSADGAGKRTGAMLGRADFTLWTDGAWVYVSLRRAKSKSASAEVFVKCWDGVWEKSNKRNQTIYFCADSFKRVDLSLEEALYIMRRFVCMESRMTKLPSCITFTHTGGVDVMHALLMCERLWSDDKSLVASHRQRLCSFLQIPNQYGDLDTLMATHSPAGWTRVEVRVRTATTTEVLPAWVPPPGLIYRLSMPADKYAVQLNTPLPDKSWAARSIGKGVTLMTLAAGPDPSQAIVHKSIAAIEKELVPSEACPVPNNAFESSDAFVLVVASQTMLKLTVNGKELQTHPCDTATLLLSRGEVTVAASVPETGRLIEVRTMCMPPARQTRLTQASSQPLSTQASSLETWRDNIIAQEHEIKAREDFKRRKVLWNDKVMRAHEDVQAIYVRKTSDNQRKIDALEPVDDAQQEQQERFLQDCEDFKQTCR
jgi:hypothetical protein